MNLLFFFSILAMTLDLTSAALPTTTSNFSSCVYTTYKGILYKKDKLFGDNRWILADNVQTCVTKCLMYPDCKAVTYAALQKLCGFHGSGIQNANPDKSLYDDNSNADLSVINCKWKLSGQGGCGTQAEAYKPVINKITRIIGGTEAKPHSWPWLCGMIIDFGNGMGAGCGCSLLRVKNGVEMSDIVLTAAHCVVQEASMATTPIPFKPEQITVTAGDHDNMQYDEGQESHKGAKIAFHEYFRFTSTTGAINDLALIKLTTPVNFTDTIRPICLPQAGEALPVLKTCVAAGWGRNNSKTLDTPTKLQQVLAPAQSSAICRVGWNSLYNETIHICAGNTAGTTGTCQGDSGGMLSCQQLDGSWRLYGATSFGVAGTCLQAGRPSVFTRLSNYVDWINKNMNEMTSVK